MQKAESSRQQAEFSDSVRSARVLPSAFFISSRGQALIEACLVIALLCLILSGLFQLALSFAGREVLAHAAARGARAATVGFNDFMVAKTVRAGAIANAGRMTFPETAGGPLAQMAVERGRIPIYLGAEWHMLDGILQYEDWDTLGHACSDSGGANLFFSVHQDLPLRYFPVFFRAFYAGDSLPLAAGAQLDNHAALYLE